MTGRLNDKTAIVTGAASGIGAGIAARFIAEGARVVLADLQVEAGTALATKLGERALFVETDVREEAQVAATVARAQEHFGALDVMVNNAGLLGVTGAVTETSADDFEQTLAVLLRGVFFGIKHAARVMKPQKRGVIVSIASTAGLRGGIGPHIYTTAKHGVVGLTRSAATELARHGVRVNAVAPGGVVTPLTAQLDPRRAGDLKQTAAAMAAVAPLGIATLPADVANAVVFLASDEARTVTGHTLVVDGGETLGTAAMVFHEPPAS